MSRCDPTSATQSRTADLDKRLHRQHEKLAIRDLRCLLDATPLVLHENPIASRLVNGHKGGLADATLAEAAQAFDVGADVVDRRQDEHLPLGAVRRGPCRRGVEA